MKIQIIAVGKVRDAHLRALQSEYTGRLGHYLPFEELELRESRLGDTPSALAEEAAGMERAAAQGAVLVAMDERGSSLTSAQFAGWIEEWMNQGVRHVAFCIGSASGLDPGFRARCPKRLALSAMTLPHEMARMVLCEQLYRAMTIIRGEPYHK